MKHIARKRFGQNFLTDGGIIDATPPHLSGDLGLKREGT